MASYRRTRAGTIEALVCVKGVRDSATFSTKAEAAAWASAREADLLVTTQKRRRVQLVERSGVGTGGALVAFFVPCKEEDIPRLLLACAARLEFFLNEELRKGKPNG